MAKSLRAAPEMRPLGVARLAHGPTMRRASRLDWSHFGQQRHHPNKREQALDYRFSRTRQMLQREAVPWPPGLRFE